MVSYSVFLGLSLYIILNFCLIFSCNLSHINLILSLAGAEEGCVTLSDNSNKPILKLINDYFQVCLLKISKNMSVTHTGSEF